MTYKKYTFCLAFLLLFNAGSTLNGSENSVSTKTMVITTGAFLFGGLLLWKRAYIAHYFLSKIFKSNNVDKKITLSSDIHHIKDTTGVQKAIVISSDKDHTSNNISVLSSIIVPSLNYIWPAEKIMKK